MRSIPEPDESEPNLNSTELDAGCRNLRETSAGVVTDLCGKALVGLRFALLSLGSMLLNLYYACDLF